MSSGKKLEELKLQRPYVQEALQTQLLYDIASLLEALLDMERERVPDGTFGGFPLDVSDEVVELSPKAKDVPHPVVSAMPWMSCQIMCDGPDPVYVLVNKRRYVVHPELRKGESVNIDMKKKGIEKIFLYCDKGKSSRVRIFALR